MARQSVIILVLFLLLLYPSASRNLTYEETDKVSLAINAADPDNDSLIISYPKPLDKKGQWQTTYGDAGVYPFNITVSDGSLSESEEILLVVLRKEAPPIVQSQKPSPSELEMDEGDSLAFSIKALDPNKDALEYAWILDGQNASKGASFAYSPSYANAGQHVISAYITDGTLAAIRQWNLSVRDVDLDRILFGDLNALEFSENDLVSIPLPDYRHYGLRVEISPPLERNLWKTGYNSSGTYPISIQVKGNGYEANRTFPLHIANVDRPPKIAPIPPQLAREGEPLTLSLMAMDPDGDKISYIMENPPNGSVFSNGVFSWTPGFDQVQSQGIAGDLSRKFQLLSKVTTISLGVESGDATVIKSIPLTILNSNRPPKIEQQSPLIIKEGDILSLNLRAMDPDNDELTISYSSSLPLGKPLDFNSQGTYMVKASASDGFLTDTSYVQVMVSNVNRPPIIGIPERVVASEGENLSVVLETKDEDNDPVSLSLIGAPQGMALLGKTLLWSVPIEGSEKQYTVSVLASDGELKTNANIEFEIIQKNHAPRIQGQTQERIAAKRGVPVRLSANATDPDNDSLTYKWVFGPFDSHRGGSSHFRTFSTVGEKKAHVQISDGAISMRKDFIVVVS